MEEKCEVRWYKPITSSFPLNEVHDELGDIGSPSDDKAYGSWIRSF